MASSASRTARPFTMVRRTLWGSRRFAGLPDDRCRYLYLYLLTCPHQASSGCFVLKEAYALADLGMTGAGWTAEAYRQAFAALVAGGLIMADEATGEVLVTRWWQDNSPNNKSWFDGARKQCGSIASERLKAAALEALDACHVAYEATLAQPPQHASGPLAPFGSVVSQALVERYRKIPK
jgi:hypothetical protein